MLRFVIDWTSDKLTSALSWVKEMASSFGFGFWKKSFEEDDDVPPDNLKKAQLPAAQMTPGEKRANCEKHLTNTMERHEGKCASRIHPNPDPDMEIAAHYPFILQREDRFRYQTFLRSTFYFAPGHAAVKLVPFVRIPSNSSEFAQFDGLSGAKTYARVVKTPPCCAKRKPEDGFYKPLLSKMDFWKLHYGIFSVFIKVDECGECTGGLSTDNLCPMTIFIVKKVRDKIAELFGKALSVEETIVFQDEKRTRMIYVAPSIEREHNKNNIYGDGIEKKAPTQESQSLDNKNCVPGKSTGDEDLYLVLEDKLMRRQDYNRKRKEGKANRRRLRMPVTSVPVTKREVALVGVKSEPVSIKFYRQRNCRKRRADEDDNIDNSENRFLVERNSEMQLQGFDFDEYDIEGKPSKRSKLMRAHFRRFLKKQKVL